MHVHSPSFIPAPRRVPAVAEDAELLRRAATDDTGAFNALFERHRDGLQGFLYRKLRRQEDAEDALTLTFCNAWRARQSFRGSSSGKAWLYRIATRVALDLLRARRRRPIEGELDALAPELLHPDFLHPDAGTGTAGAWREEAISDPGVRALQREWTDECRGAVRQAMSRLPEDERQLVDLFYFREYSYEQISETLGVSRSQVRGRLHRIRTRMRQDLTQRQQWQPA